MGLYLARSVSYDGVDYRTLVHDLAPHQARTYDRCAEAWQVVLRNLQAALEVTKADKCGRARAAGGNPCCLSAKHMFRKYIAIFADLNETEKMR